MQEEPLFVCVIRKFEVRGTPQLQRARLMWTGTRQSQAPNSRGAKNQWEAPRRAQADKDTARQGPTHWRTGSKGSGMLPSEASLMTPGHRVRRCSVTSIPGFSR